MKQGFEGTRGCLGVHGSLWRNTSLSSRWDPELHFSASLGWPRRDSVEVEAPGKENQRSVPLKGPVGASG